MSSYCCPEKSAKAGAAPRCPESGSIGKVVERQTVKALLGESALQRLTPADYRFCPDATCGVVYFSDDGVRFTTGDVRVGVWQKLPFGARQMCYCFGETEASIRSEIEATGVSSAAARIREHIVAGRCACELRNPRGACCMGDVIAAVKRVESSITNGVHARLDSLGGDVDVD
jgi:Zinc binding domain